MTDRIDVEAVMAGKLPMVLLRIGESMARVEEIEFPLWGIWLPGSGTWMVEGSGVVFHTVSKRIALAQQRAWSMPERSVVARFDREGEPQDLPRD